MHSLNDNFHRHHFGKVVVASAFLTVYKTLEWSLRVVKCEYIIIFLNHLCGCIRLRLFPSGSSSQFEHLSNINSCFSHLGECPGSPRSYVQNLACFIGYVWANDQIMIWSEEHNQPDADSVCGSGSHRNRPRSPKNPARVCFRVLGCLAKYIKRLLQHSPPICDTHHYICVSNSIWQFSEKTKRKEMEILKRERQWLCTF